MTPQLKAFLDTIAHSEIGQGLLIRSADGYNVLVGSTPAAPKLFTSYADHPRVLVDLGNGLKSTAAGRYQILARYFDVYKKQLGLSDFSPASQDAIAVQLIRECQAIDDISNGHIEAALYKCRSRWASLPGASYGQHENRMVDLLGAFRAAGGIVVAST